MSDVTPLAAPGPPPPPGLASPGDASSGKLLACPVCPHACRRSERQNGICGARGVRGGRVVSLNYGQATALALDPIEKKPLARFHPGSSILSYGSYGCNLSCNFCQNADISTATAAQPPATQRITPDELVEQAAALTPTGNCGIALTYNEPLIAPEFLIDTAQLAHDRGLVTVAVTNGYVNLDTWQACLACLDAVNIDLKCFSEDGYASLDAPGGLAVVKRSIETAVRAGVHVEVTTLVVPGLSDDAEAFEREVRWLATLDRNIPLHISRFFPRYQAQASSPTNPRVLHAFEAIARKHLTYVYLGNL